MLQWLGWLRNEIDFPLRTWLRLRRKGCRLPCEEKGGLFQGTVGSEADRLVTAYGLQRWRQVSGRQDYAASLFYLQMLERAFREAGVALPSTVSALDAGCGDWFYVQALHGLLSRYGTSTLRSVSLNGVELDAYQPYEGLHSRMDWALAFAEGLEGVRYLPQDIRRYQHPCDVAFLLFPFLMGDDLRRWGLPRRYLRPGELLGHVWTRVEPGGWLVTANLGEGERDRQHQLLADAGIPVVWWGGHESPLYHYDSIRYVTVARRAR